MRTTRVGRASFLWLLAVLALATLAAPALGELQTVVVGGQVQVRGLYWSNNFNPGTTPLLVDFGLRWPANALGGRAIGSFLSGQNIISHFDWDDHGPDYKAIEQRTRLHVRADFSDCVTAFTELDSYDAWGEDFRSNYLTGVDNRAATNEDVSVYQAYIEAGNLFGTPLRLRLGRQELVFGNGWLAGDNTNLVEATGLSYDGIRLTYATDLYSIDAFWAKLLERSPFEEDGDTDFQGIYASYLGFEGLTLDAYWFWLRDGQALADTRDPWYAERIEDAFGFDDYDVTNLHTVGLRAAGKVAAFDFDAQAAYQFGDASTVGSLFKPYVYGDDRADFGKWAADLEVGYAFDCPWAPRVYAGGAYFGGEDNRDVSFWEWLNPLAPFMKPEASVSFNRLFSNRSYSPFFDEMCELTNFWTVRGGVTAKPTEALEASASLSYFASLATFDQPIHFWFSRARVIPFPNWSFWTDESSSDLGWQIDLWVKYHYSADLTFKAGWSHLFTGDGLKDGNFNDFNGLLYNGGTDCDDADYLFVESALKF